jgi:predicted transport protein
MKSAIYMEGKRFTETEFEREEEFEKIIRDNSKTLFGSKTVYFDLKNKVESKTLGSAIPDGLLFDFKDKENPEFYLLEVELQKHDFYKHMFPQITKFFAFFKNPTSRNNLIDKVFSIVKSDPKLEAEFTELLGKKEIYKSLKDMIENSQNILLILDENKPELQEVFETYTDTWDKMVKVEILKQYTANGKTIFTMNPDFEEIELVEPTVEEEAEEGYPERYSESYHLEDVENNIVRVYEKIKNAMTRLDPEIKVNPQKYYISLRKTKNFAYVRLKKKKMHITIMLPFELGSSLIKKHKLKQLSEGVQKFYNGPCFKVTLENEDNLDEVFKALEEAYKRWQ